MRHLAILGLALAVACAADDAPETVYDPCSPLTLAVEPDLGDTERTAVESAIAAWQHVLPTRISIGDRTAATDVLPVRFVSGDTFYRAIYWDFEGSISISRDRLAEHDYALALAHELGHAFGLLHVRATDRASVMNEGNLELAPTTADAADVAARWSTCAPGAVR